MSFIRFHIGRLIYWSPPGRFLLWLVAPAKQAEERKMLDAIFGVAPSGHGDRIDYDPRDGAA